MNMIRLLVFLSLFYSSYAVYFDSFRGTPSTKNELKYYETAKLLSFCTNEIRPCDPKEGRRVGGSCNNLEHPSRGTIHTPPHRMLPEWFAEDYEPKKAASGNELPLPRHTRMELMPDGRVSSLKFTQLLTYYLLYTVEENLSNHDIVRYVIGKGYSCCSAQGEADPECVNNKIPDDDPVLRFSNQRCMNMTKPMTLQSTGCTGLGSSPVRTSFETALWDLSVVYGNTEEESQKSRTHNGGLLRYDLVNGYFWPPQGTTEMCLLNEGPDETRCHDSPDPLITNSLVGISFFYIHFLRSHNMLAMELAELNPCWDDQKLFDVARDINIAMELQMLYYEVMPLLLGKKNLIKDKIISSSRGFRNVYDKTVIPQQSLEYPFALRYLHTMQEGALKFYDVDGSYLSEIPTVNVSSRTGLVFNKISEITQGSFRQACAAIDHLVDPDIGEMGLGGLQTLLDITTNDVSKSRLFGLQTYSKYREFCFSKPINCWEDLRGIIDDEKLERLQTLYESVHDIDLLAGMWVEKPMSGGHTPPMFYCLVIDQLRRNIVSDRHWYESSERPNAFTEKQLREIRKVTMASYLCAYGESVTEIQPHAFATIGKGNKLTKCSELPKLDITKWKDTTCDESCDA